MSEKGGIKKKKYIDDVTDERVLTGKDKLFSTKHYERILSVKDLLNLERSEKSSTDNDCN